MLPLHACSSRPACPVLIFSNWLTIPSLPQIPLFTVCYLLLFLPIDPLGTLAFVFKYDDDDFFVPLCVRVCLITTKDGGGEGVASSGVVVTYLGC